jgi:hypothetical protein
MENNNNLGLVIKQTVVEKIIHKLYEDGYIQFPLPTKLYHDFKQMEQEQIMNDFSLGQDIAAWDSEQYYNKVYGK